MYRSLPFKSDSLIRTVVMVVSRNETGKSPLHTGKVPPFPNSSLRAKVNHRRHM